MLVSNFTAAAVISMVVTCLIAWNLDNFKHEDGVYVLWSVTATLRGVMFSRDNSVCRCVTDHRNPEDRETDSLRNDGYKLPYSYG